LACQDEFFANNPLDVKKKVEQAPDFALCLSPFSVCPEPSMPLKHPFMAHAFFFEHFQIHDYK
jgi:hypothetical protein